MALPWVRLDTAFPRNHKVLALIADKKWQAVTCYISGLAYAGEQGSDGFLPSPCLPFIHGTSRIADSLVEVGLWQGVPGGWLINGWLEFQASSEEHAARSRKARAAAELRWHGDKQKKGGSK